MLRPCITINQLKGEFACLLYTVIYIVNEHFLIHVTVITGLCLQKATKKTDRPRLEDKDDRSSSLPVSSGNYLLSCQQIPFLLKLESVSVACSQTIIQ